MGFTHEDADLDLSYLHDKHGDADDSSLLGTPKSALPVDAGHIHGCGHPVRPVFMRDSIVSYARYSEWEDEHDEAIRENKPCICFYCWQKANDPDKRDCANDEPIKEKPGDDNMPTFKEKQIKIMRTDELEMRLEGIQEKYNKLGDEYRMISEELQDRRNKEQN